MKQASFSSSSSSSRNSTSLTNRLKTIFKKALELSILCAIEVCVIYYGPGGELKTWPKERETVKDMALRYKEARKRKKSLNLHEFLDKEKDKDKDKDKGKTNLKKKQKKNVKYHDWYPNFDHYSPHQLSQLNQSLEQTLSTLQERLRFVEAQKQQNINLVDQNLTPSYLNQNQHLNPSKFSLYMYNHGDATLSQLPLSASHSDQLTNYQNHLMQQQELYGFGQNLCLGNITNTNFQRPYVSNTQDYSPLLSAQASVVNNYGLNNHSMQKQDLHGIDRNVCMLSEIINNNNNNDLQHPNLSNKIPHEFSSDFQQNPYFNTVGNTSFSQDMFSSYDASSLHQTSSLPPLHNIPNSYCFSDNSRLL
ncbi:hypothetical protein ARALYDRAFT_496768 [Arabidopsis lyrata subsp. lyrata]|uniref:MADS-box domain-containing protein n=1 Tax=Arabidopsis lyrata subsp. lyrata TaxID=81972 RepID=D7MTX2_ARALL|nr:agamous-like MADS-box protein AGL75 [Arabidopsis lyrata subsp. lyrata]EFH41211.1 hypothetical protein ARALYDRAFT_496768 [Arabidopsis lyrata subsp. lyrata]|eukprot:XP_002864952.1 agamous-like MADS-box protein AGL75 [Arabidopsis lyrata subsp. lyrata]